MCPNLVPKQVPQRPTIYILLSEILVLRPKSVCVYIFMQKRKPGSIHLPNAVSTAHACLLARPCMPSTMEKANAIMSFVTRQELFGLWYDL